MYELIHNFCPKSQNTSPVSQKQNKRITQILEYINQHYREPITLAQIAGNAYISVSYLSRFFQHEMKMTPLNYINILRLGHSLKDLIYTEKSIGEIADENGFPNHRSYTFAFQKYYGMTPSQYRREHTHPEQQQKNDTIRSGFNYMELEEHRYLSKLAQYLSPTTLLDEAHSPVLITDTVVVNTLYRGNTFPHAFQVFTSVGRAKELLLAPIQEMLRITQKEIGFQYIKFHGILSDDMMVYDEDKTGTPSYCFTYVDMVIDFLLSIGLKPLIQLSFMPRAMAKTPNRTRFYSPMVMGVPKDWNKWENLVCALTYHFLKRYGKQEVEQWLFSPWNEPDTNTNMYGFETVDEFYELHRRSYRAVKSCDKKLRFGGASLQPLFHEEQNFGEKYYKWCIQNDCTPDFFNINYYDLEVTHYHNQNIWDNVSQNHLSLSTDPDSFGHFIDTLKKRIHIDGLDNLPIFMTEWNSTPLHNNLISDTCFKSVYIVKNILQNYNKLNSFGYWLLSDLHEEYRISQQLFHGGLGMFTYNGIKKTGYYAYLFLSRMGSEVLANGNDYFVTRSDKGIQIMLYYYVHFTELYAIGEPFDMTFINRYTPFAKKQKKQMTVRFTGLKNGQYRLKERWINKSSGSSFDQWLKMGAVPLNAEETETLKSLSEPQCQIQVISVTKGTYEFYTILEPLEIRLIELDYQDLNQEIN